ncbi:hypothetical protein ATO10_01470 [Actibacterium atlanticum]|uniref:Uncharacterized protein n=1 Tax=Actibacterium atlanticum TaxID=1461693 RepID=A0A058ZP65_9RHOB|nr:hypothetical protein [Actibacterium atlanticum]KCV83389.1 hypothetical protein ATO10_01470 [Actibacterium atlanticum]
MPVSFRIFPRRGLVYVRYDGVAQIDETSEAFAAYAQHPDCQPGQKQLVDLTHLTGYDEDYVKLMQVQAQKADVLAQGPVETLMIYHATTDIALRVAHLAKRSWQDVAGMVTVVTQDEAEALSLLGQSERSFSALLEQMA